MGKTNCLHVLETGSLICMIDQSVKRELFSLPPVRAGRSVTSWLALTVSPLFSSPRTESVAEKMLTNWFTFLLYKFLKVKLSIPAEMHKSFEALLIPAAVLGV